MTFASLYISLYFYEASARVVRVSSTLDNVAHLPIGVRDSSSVKKAQVTET